MDFELNVCDTQPSCVGGARKEFIFSGRLDNLASSYCALRALLDTCPDSASLADESCIRAIALFDNEEVIFIVWPSFYYLGVSHYHVAYESWHISLFLFLFSSSLFICYSRIFKFVHR